MKRIQLAQKLLLQPQKAIKTLIGFDGFTDEIVRAVDKRSDIYNSTPIATIQDFAARIQAASGKSCNIELELIEKKIGGNGPILASALSALIKTAPTLIGALGFPEIEPLFQPLEKKCKKVISIAPSGHTDAIEFTDGKILFGKQQGIFDVTVSRLLACVTAEELIALFDEADCIVFANWTMLYSMTEIWKFVAQNILPKLPSKTTYRRCFIDLADPAKRSDEDLKDALDTMKSMKEGLHITLGLNEAEALRLLSLYNITFSLEKKEAIEQAAIILLEKTDLNQVVIHTRKYAAAASYEDTASVEGPFIEHPKITTGGGDHFNAGFLAGSAYDCPLKESLLLAVATSGFFVRHGSSPTIEDLIHFLRQG